MALLERLQILIDADGKGAVSEFHKVGDVAEKEAARAEKGIERTAKRRHDRGGREDRADHGKQCGQQRLKNDFLHDVGRHCIRTGNISLRCRERF